MTAVRDEVAFLRETVLSARKRPMSTSVTLDPREVLDALDRIEAAYAAATDESRDLVSRREEVIAASDDEASEILRLARLEQGRLVSDTEVFRVAIREGEELVANAREEAAGLRSETDAYVSSQLNVLAQQLEGTLAEVRRGIERLAPAETGPDRVLLAEPAPL